MAKTWLASYNEYTVTTPSVTVDATTSSARLPSPAKPSFTENAHIEDGELELRRQQETHNIVIVPTPHDTTLPMEVEAANTEVKGTGTAEQPLYTIRRYINHFAEALIKLLIDGIGGWTTDSRLRHIKGLTVLITYTGSHIVSYLPIIYHTLSSTITDDDNYVRTETENCVRNIGRNLNGCEEALDLLVPRAVGVLPGSDTVSQRK